jgi:PAS domain S-box-containing protein
MKKNIHIKEFINNRHNFKTYNQIIAQGLNTFLTFRDISATSFYYLNIKTLEFEHHSTSPSDFEANSNVIFNKLIDSGEVGRTLSSGDINVINGYHVDSVSANCICLPMLNKTGIFALALIYSEQFIDYSEDEICELEYFNSVFSLYLENADMNLKLVKTNKLLEQKVAARTMNLAQSKRELQAIFNAVQSGILVVHPESKQILNHNFVASNLIGDPPEKIISTQIDKYLPKPNKKSFSIDRDFTLISSFESELQCSDGRRIPILRSISNIALGEIQLRIESFIDISERISAERALQNANELLELKVEERTEDLTILVGKLKEEISERKNVEDELRKVLRKEQELGDLKSKFVSIVSHEFRTPLTIISSAAQILNKFKKKFTEKEQNEYTNRILKTVDFLTDLMDNVIFIGRSDTNNIKLITNEFDFANFCKSVVQDFELSLGDSRVIEFNNSCNRTMINTDEKALRHILVNLLSNALKYSPKEYPVKVDIDNDNEVFFLSVSDKGIGIPQEDQMRIFDQFYRASNVGDISGTGLGMSVVLRSLEILGGSIEVDSTIDVGTKFLIKLKSSDN